MKNTLLILGFLFSTFLFSQKINWKTMEEADQIQKKEPAKKIFIDVYTTWCGPCKMLDQYTFSDDVLAAYINENFIPVKLDAEHKSSIKFKGNKFDFIPAGRSGYNELAYYILEGRLSFPSMVILNANMTIDEVIMGVQPANELLEKLKVHIKK